MIHKQSFFLGYDKGIEEYRKTVYAENHEKFMTNEQAYQITKATITDTAALAGIVEHISNHWHFQFNLDETIIIKDKWERRWLIKPIMTEDIMMPFILIPLPKE